MITQPISKLKDEAIRAEALNIHESFIVQAPAGSGKTTLLTKRLLRLLTSVNERPEECLAITFTRKAAGEMRDRVLSALEFASNNPTLDKENKDYEIWVLAQKLLMRDKQAGWNLLKNPSRLRIQTVDSLCASITRSMPILSQFGASPTIVEDEEPLYQEAAMELLLNLKAGTEESLSDAIAILLKHLDNHLGKAQRLLAEMLSFREQWLPYIGFSASINKARTVLEQGMQTAIRDNLHKLVNTIPDTISMGAQEILCLAAYAVTELDNSDKSLLYREWPGQDLKDLPAWLFIAELLLTEDNRLRKTVTQNQGFKSASQEKNKEEKIKLQTMKQRMLAVLKELEAYPDFRSALEDLRNSPLKNYTDNEWEMIEALIKLLPALVAELTYIFQKRGQVDFAEVLLAASRALGHSDEPSDLALKWDNQLRHILVDEFQDISVPQLRLLEQLTMTFEPRDGKTLFLVGDPQQSIYRFRQAEVGLFLQVKEKGIGSIKLKSLNLTTNFRSSPNIVAWVNQFFAKTFPSRDEIGTGAIAYSPSIAALSQDEALCPTMIQEVDEESESKVLLEVIQDVKQKHAKGSIALLVRSRHHLKTLIPALQQAGISYQGVEIEPLRSKAILQDLLSLTKALLHVGDKVAWLSLLRSPYCDLSLNDLFILANHEPDLPLWWTLQSYTQLEALSEPLSKNALDKLHYLVPCLKEALEQKDRLPLSVWIHQTWLKLTGRQRENSQVEETFFAILEEQGFSNDFYDITLLEKRFQNLYAKSINHDPNALQVMTIHKAKGLEFDTVIVAGVGRASRVDTEKLLLWESRASLLSHPYLILAPIRKASEKEAVTYAYLKNENRKREQFEAQRLLYVAATRAKKRLVWMQHNHRNGENTEPGQNNQAEKLV